MLDLEAIRAICEAATADLVAEYECGSYLSTHGYATIKEALSNIPALLTEVERLQSGMFTYCLYCGERYDPENADAIKEHIEQCPKHPVSALKKEVERLQAERDAAGVWPVKIGAKFCGMEIVAADVARLTVTLRWRNEANHDNG